MIGPDVLAQSQRLARGGQFIHCMYSDDKAQIPLRWLCDNFSYFVMHTNRKSRRLCRPQSSRTFSL